MEVLLGSPCYLQIFLSKEVSQVAVKLNLSSQYFLSSIIEHNRVSRPPTSSETHALDRLCEQFAYVAQDPNIEDLSVSPELSPKDTLYLISSGCPEIIKMTLILLCYQKELSVNDTDKFSILLGVLEHYPDIFPILLRYEGFQYQDDVSSKLSKFRIKYHWRQRPKRQARIRGYRDHGTAQDIESVARAQCLESYYLEQFRAQLRRDEGIEKMLEDYRRNL